MEATSLGVPNRPMGILESMKARCLELICSKMAVKTAAGVTQYFEACWVEFGGQYLGTVSGQRQCTGPTDPLARCRHQGKFSC